MGTHVIRISVAFALVALLASAVGCGSPSASSEQQPAAVATESAEPAEQQETPAAKPEAPGDVSGMSGWFEQAYPGAAWLARIKSIEYVAGEVPDSGGFSNAVVITTDLDYASEQALGAEIVAALGEASPTWAKQYVLWFADGNNMLAGDIFDPTP